MAWRSLRTRLTLAFVAVAVASVAGVFLYVSAPLRDELRAQTLESLSERASQQVPGLNQVLTESVSRRAVERRVRQIGDRTNSRATLLAVSRGPLSLTVVPLTDSSGEASPRDLTFDIALDAARLRETRTGREAGAGGSQGQAAVPILDRAGNTTHVLVLSTPLAAVERNVTLVRERIITAGLLVLALSLVAGLALSYPLVRRIVALEKGAERVAAGDFSTRFATHEDDELGELSRTLDTMRGQLAELDSARKRFIATASHELRTPIFSLGGFLELLEDEDVDDATRRDFVAEVRGQVERLQRLTTSLLDLSRLEAGSLSFHPEEIDVGGLVRDVAREFAPTLAQAHSNLRVRVDDGPVVTVCDPDRVAQVIRILIDNAIRHTPEGTDISVRAHRRPEGGVAVTVHDDGPGIRREVLGRVFDPFVTGDDVRGSGLGLAIARELVERMRGQLLVASIPTATTFTLELPA